LSFDIDVRPVRRLGLAALLLIVVVAIVRPIFPEAFCAVRWPSPLLRRALDRSLGDGASTFAYVPGTGPVVPTTLRHPPIFKPTQP
jgi:hypothetical protein